jgi:hypothetical protein
MKNSAVVLGFASLTPTYTRYAIEICGSRHDAGIVLHGASR